MILSLQCCWIFWKAASAGTQPSTTTMCCLLRCWWLAQLETAAGLSLGPAVGLELGTSRSPGKVGAPAGTWGEWGEGTALLHGVWRRNKTNWGKGVTVLAQSFQLLYLYISSELKLLLKQADLYPFQALLHTVPLFFSSCCYKSGCSCWYKYSVFLRIFLNFPGPESNLLGFALHGVIKFSLYKSLICCLLNISLHLFYIIGKVRRKCILDRDSWSLYLKEKACVSLL